MPTEIKTESRDLWLRSKGRSGGGCELEDDEAAAEEATAAAAGAEAEASAEEEPAAPERAAAPAPEAAITDDPAAVCDELDMRGRSDNDVMKLH